MSFVENGFIKWKQFSVFEKIIAINVSVFILGALINFMLGTNSSLPWFALPSNWISCIKQPWSIFTYAFVHYDFFHLLFNMLWLYFIGSLFVNLFNYRLGLNIYFLGAITGGLFFLLGYALFPQIFGGGSNLVGASAAIRALLIFVCVYMPTKEIRFFTFKLQLKHIGIAIVVLDMLGLINSYNRGGNLAHFGGTFLGYLYATQLVKGNDIGRGFEQFMDKIISIFKSNPTKLKTVHKKTNKVAGFKKEEFKSFNNQKQIDVILDKISKSGYESLTKEEKEFLFRAGR